jgi:hypothetical protein
MRIHRHKETNRLWIYYKGHRHLLNLEWQIFNKATHAGIDIGWRKQPGRHSPKLFVGIPWLFNLWAHLFDVDEWEDYELGIRFHDGSIWFHVFSNPTESSSSDPWYRKTHCFNPADFFLGRHKYTNEITGTEEVEIPMPEGVYKGIAKFETTTWKRPRWPWPRIRKGVWIDVKDGVPFPGKGENSWDCGMDGLHGAGVDNESVGRAIGHFVGCVLEYRRRYGGKNWKLSEDLTKKTA